MQGDTISIETLTGAALLPHLKDLARLRIAVFREYPYLYEGDAAYEASYLARYTRDGGAVVLARDGAAVVGAATCLPLAVESDAIRAPFEDHGLDPERFFYFGESVLLPAYRGRTARSTGSGAGAATCPIPTSSATWPGARSARRRRPRTTSPSGSAPWAMRRCRDTAPAPRRAGLAGGPWRGARCQARSLVRGRPR